jgi:hypothetical protein
MLRSSQRKEQETRKRNGVAVRGRPGGTERGKGGGGRGRKGGGGKEGGGRREGEGGRRTVAAPTCFATTTRTPSLGPMLLHPSRLPTDPGGIRSGSREVLVVCPFALQPATTTNYQKEPRRNRAVCVCVRWGQCDSPACICDKLEVQVAVGLQGSSKMVSFVILSNMPCRAAAQSTCYLLPP